MFELSETEKVGGGGATHRGEVRKQGAARGAGTWNAYHVLECPCRLPLDAHAGMEATIAGRFMD